MNGIAKQFTYTHTPNLPVGLMAVMRLHRWLAVSTATTTITTITIVVSAATAVGAVDGCGDSVDASSATDS